MPFLVWAILEKKEATESNPLMKGGGSFLKVNRDTKYCAQDRGAIKKS